MAHKTYPRMVTVRQSFPAGRLENVAGSVDARLRESGVPNSVASGTSVAIAVGSRGIRDIVTITARVVAMCRECGAAPFIVPAMGSHGGATAGGQREVLARLGITEEAVGAPVRSSMETRVIGSLDNGGQVRMDALAAAADGIIAINRVKLHTAFHGPVESGLCKMVAVGLGKREGASTMHRLGLGDAIVGACRTACSAAPVIGGVAVLENARDETLDVRVAAPDDFEYTDRELLARCRRLFPRIPVPEFDVLIVDEMGKNISGAGMDPNVIGLWRRFSAPKTPDYSTLIVRSLTPESGGNALGLGLADLTTRRCVDTIDYTATYANVITSMEWKMGRIPVTLDTDRACIDTLLQAFGADACRLVRIRNTLSLEYFGVSENLVPVVEQNALLEITGQPVPMAFDKAGGLL